jgi:hypothetical protein
MAQPHPQPSTHYSFSYRSIPIAGFWSAIAHLPIWGIQYPLTIPYAINVSTTGMFPPGCLVELTLGCSRRLAVSQEVNHRRVTISTRLSLTGSLGLLRYPPDGKPGNAYSQTIRRSRNSNYSFDSGWHVIIPGCPLPLCWSIWSCILTD